MSYTASRYKDICTKALDARAKHDLSDTETLLYNHVCRKDFYLYNDNPQKFYDPDNDRYCGRQWGKAKFQRLVDLGLVKFESQTAPRDARYRIWHWYDPDVFYSDLVSGGCHVTTHKFFILKKYLGLPDGFNKNGGLYGDIEFLREIKYYDTQSKLTTDITNCYRVYYTFNYKNRHHNQTFCDNRIEYDSGTNFNEWLTKEAFERDPYLYEDDFERLVHRIYDHIEYYDKVDLSKIRHDSTTRKICTVEGHSVL